MSVVSTLIPLKLWISLVFFFSVKAVSGSVPINPSGTLPSGALFLEFWALGQRPCLRPSFFSIQNSFCTLGVPGTRALAFAHAHSPSNPRKGSCLPLSEERGRHQASWLVPSKARAPHIERHWNLSVHNILTFWSQFLELTRHNRLWASQTCVLRFVCCPSEYFTFQSVQCWSAQMCLRRNNPVNWVCLSPCQLLSSPSVVTQGS